MEERPKRVRVCAPDADDLALGWRYVGEHGLEDFDGVGEDGRPEREDGPTGDEGDDTAVFLWLDEAVARDLTTGGVSWAAGPEDDVVARVVKREILFVWVVRHVGRGFGSFGGRGI